MKKLAVILLFLCALCAAQTPSRRLSYGIDPVSDTLAFREIRARMDKIRERRPTVALVLSGGGAKGTAHIGVMRYVDSLKIPIDLIVGTSMGGLIGCMYAMGYNQHEVDSIVSGFDWSLSLSDRLPRRYLSYGVNRYNEKFLVSIPFYYPKRYDLSPDRRYPGLHLGAVVPEDGPMNNGLLGGLPSGFVYGQNVNNIFCSLTVGYQDETDFFDFPIPYVCVATEMVSAKEKIWMSGKVNSALRSTMAIPGLFTPVRTNGMILLDGGLRNNYPTDIARKMGADLIIGVDLSSGFLDYDGINNLGDIVMQGIDMLGRASYEDNVRKTEVTVKPDVSGIGMLGFDKSEETEHRGYLAAAAEGENLMALKELAGSDTLTLRNRKAIDIGRCKVAVSGVEIEGVTFDESRYLMQQLKIKAGQRMGRKELEDAVATIYGTKAFDYVTYELLGREEPFRLKFHCKRGPINQFGLSGRFDSEEMISVLLNLGLNVHSIQGHALDVTAKVGTNPWATAHYYYMTKRGPAINVSAGFKYVERNQFRINDNFSSSLLEPFEVGKENRLKTSYFNVSVDTWISNFKWKNFDLRAGFRADYYDLSSVMAEKILSDYDADNFNNIYLGLHADAGEDSYDIPYFPESGTKATLEYRWIFKGVKSSISPFHSFKVDFKTVALNKGIFAMLPFFNARVILGDDIPLPFVNTVGGRLSGRYLPYQVPFMGVNYAYALPKVLGVAGSDFRLKVYKNNYVTAIVNMGYCSEGIRNIFNKDKSSAFIGAGLEYAYNSVLGPIRVDFHWSSLTHAVGAYVAIGFDF